MRFPMEGNPKLLVSVRNASEAQAALEGGAEILDIKEPQYGSLGKANDQSIEEIANTICNLEKDCPLSVALGELHEWQISDTLPQLPSRVNYVKLGFSRCQSVDNWRERWNAFRLRLTANSPTAPDWVAVIYADWQSAESPPPQNILDAVTELPCAAVLIDTFHKNGRSLFDIVSSKELLTFAAHVHRLGLPLAVAGSLRISDLSQLQSLAPQIVAIRSAACLGGQRGGPVSASAVCQFRDQMARTKSARLPRLS